MLISFALTSLVAAQLSGFGTIGNVGIGKGLGLGVPAEAAPDATPGVLRTYNVMSWTRSAPVDAEGAQVLKKGQRVALWTIACEPSTDATTFDNPSNLKCTPARFNNLPASAPGPDGNGTAQETLAHLSRCYSTHVERAPDAVIDALLKADVDAVNAIVNARAERTVVFAVTMTPSEGERIFSVTMSSGDVVVPTGAQNGPLALVLVQAPGARALMKDFHTKHYRAAVDAAARTYATAADPSTKAKAAGNVALAAMLAGDRDVGKKILEHIDADNGAAGSDDDAGAAAAGNVEYLRSWVNGDLDLTDSCG